MAIVKNDLLFAAPLAALMAMGLSPATAQTDTKINANLFTTYQYVASDTAISWLTCGSTQQSNGCFGSGQLTGFGKACASLQGRAVIKGDTVTQKLYVLDSLYQGGTSLFLDIYKKTDVITSSYDTTTFTLSKRINLQIPAGSNVSCFAAANAGFVFAGTNTSTNAVRVSKADDSLAFFGGFSPPLPLTSIAADDRGYVAINFSNSTGSGFLLAGPTGQLVEDGGGNQTIFNQENAITP